MRAGYNSRLLCLLRAKLFGPSGSAVLIMLVFSIPVPVLADGALPPFEDLRALNYPKETRKELEFEFGEQEVSVAAVQEAQAMVQRTQLLEKTQVALIDVALARMKSAAAHAKLATFDGDDKGAEQWELEAEQWGVLVEWRRLEAKAIAAGRRHAQAKLNWSKSGAATAEARVEQALIDAYRRHFDDAPKVQKALARATRKLLSRQRPKEHNEGLMEQAQNAAETSRATADSYRAEQDVDRLLRMLSAK